MSSITESTNLNGNHRAADRVATNRTNALRSTDPRTQAVKQRTRLTALRHRFTGQTLVMSTQDHAAYQRHSQSFLDEYQPKGAIETQLVQMLIDTSWQLKRTAAIESSLLSLGIAEMEDEASLMRQFETTPPKS